jgi:hypothetical protein
MSLCDRSTSRLTQSALCFIPHPLFQKGSSSLASLQTYLYSDGINLSNTLSPREACRHTYIKRAIPVDPENTQNSPEEGHSRRYPNTMWGYQAVRAYEGSPKLGNSPEAILMLSWGLQAGTLQKNSNPYHHRPWSHESVPESPQIPNRARLPHCPLLLAHWHRHKAQFFPQFLQRCEQSKSLEISLHQCDLRTVLLIPEVLGSTLGSCQGVFCPTNSVSCLCGIQVPPEDVLFGFGFCVLFMKIGEKVFKGGKYTLTDTQIQLQ